MTFSITNAVLSTARESAPYTVLVVNGHLEAVGGEEAIRADEAIIDASRGTLLPGSIDSLTLLIHPLVMGCGPVASPPSRA